MASRMAPRKRKRPTKPAKLDAEAHRQLLVLQQLLADQDLPSYVDQMEILSALVLYTSPEQVAGMLRGYWRYTRRLQAGLDSEAAEQE
jgi:hypothetical protein